VYPDGTPWYSGVIGSFYPDTYSSVSFECPNNGLLSDALSYFSVMMAPSDPAVPALADDADVSIVGVEGKYPAPEEEVFTFREGSFFGDIFDVKANCTPDDPNKILADHVLVGDQYACYSDSWTNAAAHENDRLCAGLGTIPGDDRCFNNVPLPCLWQGSEPGTLALGHCCNAQSCGEDQSYLDCSWSGSGSDGLVPWDHAITTFLNHPCDLAKDLQSCQRAYKDFDPLRLPMRSMMPKQK
jgi:hypothetical protein